MGHILQGVHNAVSVVIGWVDAPGVTRLGVGSKLDAVGNEISHVVVLICWVHAQPARTTLAFHTGLASKGGLNVCGGQQLDQGCCDYQQLDLALFTGWRQVLSVLGSQDKHLSAALMSDMSGVHEQPASSNQLGHAGRVYVLRAQQPTCTHGRQLLILWPQALVLLTRT